MLRLGRVYNILQSEIATKLRDRKLANIEATGADVIASGNIGCMTQLGTASGKPVVHVVELLDWATGGPCPQALQSIEHNARASPRPPERRRVPAHKMTECFQSQELIMQRQTVEGLQVAKILYDFINEEALPGTGVASESFWARLCRIAARPGAAQPRSARSSRRLAG